MIIVLEGIDGSGKTSLCKLIEPILSEKLKTKIETVHWYSFINYPDELEKLAFSGAKKLKATHVLEPLANSLWHCADFAHRWESQVLPALKVGRPVLFDRSMYSALVRDCERGVNEDYVKSLYLYVQKPDLVIYLDIPAEIAAKRKGNDISYYEAGLDIKQNSNKSKVEGFIDFQTKCQIRYKKILPKDALIIDATLDQNVIAEKVIEAVINVYQSKKIGGEIQLNQKPFYRMEAA